MQVNENIFRSAQLDQSTHSPGSVQYNRSVELQVPSASSRPGQRNSDLYRRLSVLPRRSAPKETSDSGDMHETQVSAKELPPTALRPGVSGLHNLLSSSRDRVEVNLPGRRDSSAIFSSCIPDTPPNSRETNVAVTACQREPSKVTQNTSQRQCVPSEDMEVPIEESRVGTMPSSFGHFQRRSLSNDTSVVDTGGFKDDLSEPQDPDELPLMQASSSRSPERTISAPSFPRLTLAQDNEEQLALDMPFAELEKSSKSPGCTLNTKSVSALPFAGDGLNLDLKTSKSNIHPTEPFRPSTGF